MNIMRKRVERVKHKYAVYAFRGEWLTRGYPTFYADYWIVAWWKARKYKKAGYIVEIRRIEGA